MEPRGRGRVERRLAAILAADVVGYSRLIEADEEGTLGRLRSLRAALTDPKIAEHRGRIVKTTGDGLLVELRPAMASTSPPVTTTPDIGEDRSPSRECNCGVASICSRRSGGALRTNQSLSFADTASAAWKRTRAAGSP